MLLTLILQFLYLSLCVSHNNSWITVYIAWFALTYRTVFFVEQLWIGCFLLFAAPSISYQCVHFLISEFRLHLINEILFQKRLMFFFAWDSMQFVACQGRRTIERLLKLCYRQYFVKSTDSSQYQIDTINEFFINIHYCQRKCDQNSNNWWFVAMKRND